MLCKAPDWPSISVLGTWALYGGFVDVWHGPGNCGALLFSNATRPFPKIGIKRLSPDAFDLPVLEWLGPWSLRIDANLDQVDGGESLGMVGTVECVEG